VIQGYPARGNNILGLVREIGDDGSVEPSYKKDRLGLPYTTLSYANGPGYQGPTKDQPRTVSPKTGRADLSKMNTSDPDYLQEAGIPMGAETHGGEDVAIYATGVNAYLIRGSMEENWIFYVMADAMRLGRK
jgi:alkaline phosphatase